MSRRSLTDALAPEKLAFIKGNAASAAEDRIKEEKAPKDTKTIEIERLQASAEPSEAKQKSTRRGSSGRTDPHATEILDEVLVPVTFRLPRRTSQALKRAYLEQKLKNAKPDTLQEIGEEAFSAWLKKTGYEF